MDTNEDVLKFCAICFSPLREGKTVPRVVAKGGISIPTCSDACANADLMQTMEITTKDADGWKQEPQSGMNKARLNSWASVIMTMAYMGAPDAKSLTTETLQGRLMGTAVRQFLAAAYGLGLVEGQNSIKE